MTDLLAGLSPDIRKSIEANGLLNDPDVTGTLGKMTLESRKDVLQRIGSLGMEWDDAITDADYIEEPDSAEAEAEEATQNPNRLVMSFRRDALTPNKYNAALFPDSLSGESIEVLAESLKQGQRVPIEVTNSHVIVDGERRWRAAELAGLEMVDVTYLGDLTDNEILDRVLDSCTSARQPSPREKTLVYKAVYERLQESLGRRHGERSPNGDLWEPKKLKELSIRRVGISSIKMAERLTAIFSKAPEDIQEKVNSGEMSVAAGYEEVPRRPKKASSVKPESESSDESDITDVTEERVWINPFAERGRLPDGTIIEEPLEAALGDERAEVPCQKALTEQGGEVLNDVGGIDDEEEPTEATEDADDEEEALDNSEEEPVEDMSSVESISVEDAVEVLAQRLEALAVVDYSVAKAEAELWLRAMFKRMKAARLSAA